MKELEKIKGVKNFHFDGKSIYLTKSVGDSNEVDFMKVSIDLKETKTLHRSNGSMRISKGYDDILFIDLNGIGHVVERQTDLYKFSSSASVFSNFKGCLRFFICSELKDMENFIYEFGVYDLLENKVKFWKNQTAFAPSVILKDRFILGSDPSSKLISNYTLNGELDWQYDYSHLESIDSTIDIVFDKVIGEFDNKIAIAFKKHHIVILEATTGKVLKVWSEIEKLNYYDKHSSLLSSQFFIDDQKGRLFGTLSNQIIKLDLNNYDSSFADLDQELNQEYDNKKYRFRDGCLSSSYDETHLIMQLTRLEPDPEMYDWVGDSFAIINQDNLKIVEIIDVDGASFGPNKTSVVDDYIFQQNTADELRIFKKNKT